MWAEQTEPNDRAVVLWKCSGYICTKFFKVLNELFIQLSIDLFSTSSILSVFRWCLWFLCTLDKALFTIVNLHISGQWMKAFYKRVFKLTFKMANDFCCCWFLFFHSFNHVEYDIDRNRFCSVRTPKNRLIGEKPSLYIIIMEHPSGYKASSSSSVQMALGLQNICKCQ